MNFRILSLGLNELGLLEIEIEDLKNGRNLRAAVEVEESAGISVVNLEPCILQDLDATAPEVQQITELVTRFANLSSPGLRTQ